MRGEISDTQPAPRSRRGAPLRRLLPLACLAGVLVATPAFADDIPDTVILANGGRMRGIVMEEDPTAGVTIKLPDGTVKKLPAARVKQVVYGGQAPKPAPAPEAPSAPPASPPGANAGAYPPAGAPPVGVLPAYGTNAGVLPAQGANRPSSPEALEGAKSMRTAGVVLTSVGVVLVLVGGVWLAVLEGQCSSLGPACSFNPIIQGALLGVGGAALIPGVILWPVGQSRINAATSPVSASLR
jgi:hypothetical protein